MLGACFIGACVVHACLLLLLSLFNSIFIVLSKGLRQAEHAVAPEKNEDAPVFARP